MTDDTFDRAPPSKSQRKREMHALRDLGAQIASMPAHQRAELPLSEALHKALLEYDRLRAREARRRHLSFIGRLMRSEDLEAVEAAVARFDAASATFTRELHALERWRDALVDDDAAVTAFIDRHPGADRPRLRTLVRRARDPDPEKAKRAYRELYRHLRDEAEHSGELQPPPERLSAPSRRR